jgi:hypothetical protein
LGPVALQTFALLSQKTFAPAAKGSGAPALGNDQTPTTRTEDARFQEPGGAKFLSFHAAATFSTPNAISFQQVRTEPFALGYKHVPRGSRGG